MKTPHRTATVALWTAALVACTSASPPPARVPDVPALAATLARKTVALYGDDHLCTGVWVSARAILTASHCIEIGDVLMYSVRGDHGDPVTGPHDVHEAALVRADLDHDLALYAAIGVVPPHDVAVAALSDPDVGEDLYFSGHVFGMFYSFRRGTVAAYRQVPSEKWSGPWMQVSASIFLGDSGGGAFDADGYLVGLAHSVAADVPGLAFFVRGSTVARFLREAGIP